VSVSETVRDEAVSEIFAWEEWRRLLDCVEPNSGAEGYLSVADERPGKSAVVRTRRREPPPTESEDFYPAFERTLRHLGQFARACTRQAAGEWLRALSVRERVALCRDAILPALQSPEVTRRVAERFGRGGLDQLASLRDATEPARWEAAVTGPDTAGDDTAWHLDAGALFPLAYAGRDRGGRAFGWSPKLKDAPADETPDPSARHQVQVFRVRDELISSASQGALQLVTGMNDRVVTALLGVFAEVYDFLRACREDAAFLACLAEDARAQGGAGGEWRQAGLELVALLAPLQPAP
jgi:hypothetical protein